MAGRATHLTTPVSPGAGWKRGAYLVAGLLGGLLTTVSGSGMDLAGFAVQTLLFRVSEKTATPTSVVLMALNTAIGFFAIEVVACTYYREELVLA